MSARPSADPLGAAADSAGTRPPGPGPSTHALLEVRGLAKGFGELVALDQVDFTAYAGEIHALLGENGAGKSTLMHVVSGLYAADAGEIAFAGRSVRWRSPEQARAAGIAMVHQHFMLVPTLTIAGNLALVRGKLGWLGRARLARETSALADRYRLGIGDPNRRIEDLSVGDRQRVEILKALVASEGAAEPNAPSPAAKASSAAPSAPPPRLLVLDEPTAVLTPDEVSSLFEMLRELALRGAAVVIVTHKLAEVLSIADRVTILRAGRVLGSGEAGRYDAASLASLMVGAPSPGAGEARETAQSACPPVGPTDAGRPVLVVEDLRGSDPRGAVVLAGVSFAVAAGETLVIAGVEGNGQTELVEALAGVAHETLRGFRGDVRLDGRSIASAAEARAAGMAVVPSDRTHEGMVAELAAWENLLLASDRLAASVQRGILVRSRAVAAARSLMRDFGVQPLDPLRPAGALSGGNQQRLILARELGRDRPRAIVAANPTRGLDLAATAAVRRRLREHARAGAAVVVLSTDLDEVEDLAGHVVVLYRGRLIDPGAQPPSRATLGRLMAGSGEAA